MAVFTSATSWVTLLAQNTPRSYGVALSSKDLSGSLLSVQVGIPNTAAGKWDAAGGWDTEYWDDINFATWVDITSRVRGLEWDRGASEPLTQPEVGTALLTLDNRDGVVSPWTNTGTFANPVDNTPKWDQDNWDASFPGAGTSLLRPGIPVRFGVTQNNTGYGVASTGGWYPFFTGIIETIEEDTSANVDGWITIGLVDMSGAVAAIGSGSNPPAGGLLDGQSPGVMMPHVLTDAGWPYSTGAWLGTYSLTPPAKIPDPTINRLQAIQQLATAGYSYIIATSDGLISMVETGQVGAENNPYGPLGDLLGDQAPFTGFSNQPSTATGAAEMPVVSIKPYSSTDRILNSVTGTSVTGLAQTYTDANSVAQFGTQNTALGWPVTDLLLVNDSDVLALVTKVVRVQSNDYIGISEIGIDCDQNPAKLYGIMVKISAFLLENPQVLRIRWVHPSGAQFIEDVVIIGFNQSITMEGGQAKWTATLRTAKAP